MAGILKKDAGGWASGINSVAWSNDEKQLAIGCDKEIYLMNLDNGVLSLLYQDSTKSPLGLYWDRNVLAFTPSVRFIVFVDYQDNYAILKSIDLKNENSITEVLRGEDISLAYNKYL